MLTKCKTSSTQNMKWPYHISHVNKYNKDATGFFGETSSSLNLIIILIYESFFFFLKVIYERFLK